MPQTPNPFFIMTLLTLVSCSGGESDADGAGGSGGGSTSMRGGASSAGGETVVDCSSSALAYDARVLCDSPVAFWAMRGATAGEVDLTGNGHPGSYQGGPFATATLPNGEGAVVFDGLSQYLTIESSGAFSIPTTGSLTWEGWISPSTLQFSNESGSGYVDWMGKCAHYSGPPADCEWEARLYSATNDEGRCSRLSAYVFNLTAGLGSAADWQPICDLVQVGQWLHVVGAYTTTTEPATCDDATTYPGKIEIWVNGVKWNQANHDPTGCMSQYAIVPEASTSPLNIGTMAYDTWFQGAIAKVALYDYLLTDEQIAVHYEAMTGLEPTGSCANTCTF